MAVRLLAAPNRQVLVAVMVGAAVLGWRMVLSDKSGAWEGDVKVFAPRVALPAVVRVVAPLGRATVEASAAIVLAGGAQVVLWDASVADGHGQRADGQVPGDRAPRLHRHDRMGDRRGRAAQRLGKRQHGPSRGDAARVGGWSRARPWQHLGRDPDPSHGHMAARAPHRVA